MTRPNSLDLREGVVASVVGGRTSRATAKGAPVCIDLKTYPVRLEGDAVLVQLD